VAREMNACNCVRSTWKNTVQLGFCKKWSSAYVLLLLSTQHFHIEAMAIDTLGRI
jgi:hypothetical protein